MLPSRLKLRIADKEVSPARASVIVFGERFDGHEFIAAPQLAPRSVVHSALPAAMARDGSAVVCTMGRSVRRVSSGRQFSRNG